MSLAQPARDLAHTGVRILLGRVGRTLAGAVHGGVTTTVAATHAHALAQAGETDLHTVEERDKRPVVAGDVPDRRRLLLHARLPARDRGARGRSALADRDPRARRAHAARARCRSTAGSPQESPHGQGSIAMLERLLPFWRGKVFVLVLLGFAATDFVITMTLSAADASAHLIENPYAPVVPARPAALGDAVPARAARRGVPARLPEAIGIAVGARRRLPGPQRRRPRRGAGPHRHNPRVVPDWTQALVQQHGDPVMMVAVSLMVFPQLALGLSGFETGVAVMPHVRGDARRGCRPGTKRAAHHRRGDHERLPGRQLVRDHAADPGEGVPARRRRPTGARWRCWPTSTSATASARPYDVSTIAILWFAGASAMAGMLNLIPRYLPRYGMSPEWAGAVRPLVLVLTGCGVPDHLDLRRRRRRPGRRLRHRRAGADHQRRGRGHAGGAAGGPAQADRGLRR